MFSFVTSLSYAEINNKEKGEGSKTIKSRIEKVRMLQSKRFEADGISFNSEMSYNNIKKYCKLDDKSNKLLERVYDKYGLSNRAYSRILRLSRTIADLNEREFIDSSDVVEAIQYRKFTEDKVI
jgi:magnesium chelatase family protein